MNWMTGPRPESRLIVRDAAEAAVQRDWHILAVSTSIIQTVHQTTGHLNCPRELRGQQWQSRGTSKMEAKLESINP